ncbi:hypothetical protein [Paenibacillus sp. F4]|uniref:hypothetical protein n=1 Tax=Paenibacillus sp. F4 TaxID=357385 RepID=UPI000C9FEECC|nr:hypothetical protein [Paenibacillus sp. F4]PNQ81956.1 hypothetical protein C1T21_06705 [Paenibacillus sp. F4]
MRQFRFGGILRKYTVPYVFIQPATGQEYDEYGDAIPAKPNRQIRKGNFQPVDAKLQLAEGGEYTDKDRTLYTTGTHKNGDLIEYQGEQYTVDSEQDRDYMDVNKYVVKKRVANDPVQ